MQKMWHSVDPEKVQYKYWNKAFCRTSAGHSYFSLSSQDCDSAMSIDLGLTNKF